MASDNPVLYQYKGVNIRKLNRVTLKLSEHHFKKIIDEVDNTGLSIHKVLAYSGKPCEKCMGTEVTAYDKNDNEIKVKKGLLHIPENNGINIIENSKKNNK